MNNILIWGHGFKNQGIICDLLQFIAMFERALTLFPLDFATSYIITVIKKSPCLVRIGLKAE